MNALLLAISLAGGGYVDVASPVDGETVVVVPNPFGQEWQVLHSEPKLFQLTRFPQHPRVCNLTSRLIENQRKQSIQGQRNLQ
jgi:hypothetical protein